jgi:hypothetical protein
MQNSKDSKIFEHLYLSKGKLRKKDLLDLAKLGINEKDIRNYSWNCKSVRISKEKTDDKGKEG